MSEGCPFCKSRSFDENKFYFVDGMAFWGRRRLRPVHLDAAEYLERMCQGFGVVEPSAVRISDLRKEFRRLGIPYEIERRPDLSRPWGDRRGYSIYFLRRVREKEGRAPGATRAAASQ